MLIRSAILRDILGSHVLCPVPILFLTPGSLVLYLLFIPHLARKREAGLCQPTFQTFSGCSNHVLTSLLSRRLQSMIR